MITSNCFICNQPMEVDDPSQVYTAWDEVNGMWEWICDECAEAS